MLNNVNLLGRIGNDLSVKASPSGGKSLNFSLAVTRNNDVTEWINCVAFSKNAESIALYCKKGSQIAITGSIHTGSYDKIGGTGTYKVYFTEIWVDKFTLCGSKESAPVEEKTSPLENNITADELPFLCP